MSTFFNEMWSTSTLEQIIEDQMTYKRVLGAITDYTPFTEGAVASAYNGPKIGALTVTDLGSGSAQDLSKSVINIPFSIRKSVKVNIPSVDQSQTNVDLLKATTSGAAKSLAEQWDLDIVTTILTNVTSSAIATSSLTETDILTARKALNAAKAPVTGRYFIVGPELESQLYKLDNFISADKIGNTLAIKDGQIGRIYGFDVILFNSMPVASGGKDQGIFLQSSAVGFGRQKSIGVGSSYDSDLYCDKVNFVSVYGLAIQEPTFIKTIKQA